MLPEGVQSNFKTIETPLFCFTAFPSIEVICKLSGESSAVLWGLQRVLVGVDIAQREELGGYFRSLQKTQRANGRWPLGGGVSMAVDSSGPPLAKKSTSEIVPAERGVLRPTAADGSRRLDATPSLRNAPVSSGCGGYVVLSPL